MKTYRYITAISFVLCLAVVNTELQASPCEINIYLEVGKQGTVHCNFQDFQILSWINGDGSYGEPTPFISLDNGVKRGRGYESGDYDILPDGSLIINNVQLKHEFNFSVSYTPNVGLRTLYSAPVSVYVRPSPDHPVVNGLTNQQYIYQEVDFYSGSINCTMNGVRPGVDLEWVYKSDVIYMENLPSSVTNNTDGTYNTSLSSHYTIRDRSVLKITLQCRVAGEMADLFPSVTTIYLLNLKRQFPVINGGTNLQHLVLQLNREDKLTCSLDRVLQGASLEWIILSPREEVMLDSEISKISNEDGTFNVTLNSRFIMIGQSVRHVVLQCGVSGRASDMYPDVTTVDVLLSEILLIPVIDGCYSQQKDCNLMMPRNGTLACSVLAVPLDYRMDMSADISADASGLSLTRIKDHHHLHVNGDMYDLTTSYQYTVDEGSTESVIKCSLSGMNNQPLDSMPTARIIWQDNLCKHKSNTGSTSDGGDSNAGWMFVSITLNVVFPIIIIITIIVVFKKLLKNPVKQSAQDPRNAEGISMLTRSGGTQVSNARLDQKSEGDIANEMQTDEETQQSRGHLHPENETDVAIRTMPTDEETQESVGLLHPENERDIANGMQTDEETQESVGHLDQQTQTTQADVRGMIHQIVSHLEHETPTIQAGLNKILKRLTLMERQSHNRETDIKGMLQHISLERQPRTSRRGSKGMSSHTIHTQGQQQFTQADDNDMFSLGSMGTNQTSSAASTCYSSDTDMA